MVDKSFLLLHCRATGSISSQKEVMAQCFFFLFVNTHTQILTHTHTLTQAPLNMLIVFVVPLKSLLAGEGKDIRELYLQLAICQVPILDRPNICLGLYCSSRHV